MKLNLDALEIQKALVYSSALVLAVAIGGAAHYLAASMTRFQITNPGELGYAYLVDRKTGEVWRYYRNTDSTGKMGSEGFQQIRKADE